MSMPSPTTYAAAFRVVELLRKSEHVTHYALSALACVEELAALRGEPELSQALRNLRAAIISDPNLPDASGFSCPELEELELDAWCSKCCHRPCECIGEARRN